MFQPQTYIRDLVREHDPDRFLITMMMPARYHGGILALLAFNHEIAKTREIVSETQLGLMRLQWWHEAIEEIYAGKEPRDHAVVNALAEAINVYDLPQEQFKNLLYAREFDLEDVLPGNMDGLINYADFTTAPLLRLICRVMGDDPDLEPVQTVAINYALTGLMRMVPYHARARRCFLPEDVMREQGVLLPDLYDLKQPEKLSDIVREVLSYCEFSCMPKNKFIGKTNILPCIYYKQIQRSGFDVFDRKLLCPPPFKALRVLLNF